LKIKFGSQKTVLEILFCLVKNKEHLQFTVNYIVENILFEMELE